MNTFFRIIMPILLGFMTMPIARAHDDHPAFSGHLVFKQDTLHIHASIPTKPVIGEESFIVLEAKNPENHEAIEITDIVEVALWMPDMGHGSAPTTVEKAVNDKGESIPGVFHIRDVYFTMGGEWDVNVTLTDTDGQSETQSFKVKLKGGHHH